jgi:hypothetical protein
MGSSKRVSRSSRSAGLAALALGGFIAAFAPVASAQPQPPRPDRTRPTAPTPRPVRVKNAAELAKMDAYLNAVRPAPQHVKHSFIAEAGHAVDCVDINHQEAMLRPQLRNHVILTPPSGAVAATAPHHPAHPAVQHGTAMPAGTQRATGMFLGAGRDASGAARACPAGTVPTTRRTIEHLKAFPTLSDYHAKYPTAAVARHHFEAARSHAPVPRPPESGAEHEHAGAGFWGLPNYGAHSTLLVANPYVLTGYNEFSLSQIWVTAGDFYDKSLQSLEVGVVKYPDQHQGDARPRLFVYSTTDAYDHHEDAQWWQTNVGTSCYNRDCGQFVQVDPTFDWDAPVTDGEVDVSVVKYGDAWWLNIQGRWIGYYPTALYSATKGLHDGAMNIDFGGEIVNSNDPSFPPAHPAWHTTTQMGTGSWPESGYGNAAYQRNLYYFWQPTNLLATYAAWGLQTHYERPGCYRAGDPAYADPNWGTYFYFGGPGYSWVTNDCKQ